jgi:hypothetical protein
MGSAQKMHSQSPLMPFMNQSIHHTKEPALAISLPKPARDDKYAPQK